MNTPEQNHIIQRFQQSAPVDVTKLLKRLDYMYGRTMLFRREYPASCFRTR
jgi:hypothetical protein